LIGRGEGWSLSENIYFGFITGTTVSYGDFRPKRLAGEAMAVVIAYVGLIQIGIVVALAGHAAAKAYEAREGHAPDPLSSAEHPTDSTGPWHHVTSGEKDNPITRPQGSLFG
jgi:Ion channel